MARADADLAARTAAQRGEDGAQEESQDGGAELLVGSAYDGPPGCVHGGMIAAAFDEVLGFTQSMAGHPGMTGTLTVRYRKPTPLHFELRFEGRVVRIEGRKLFVAATLHAGDTLCAECEAIFIRVDFARLAALAEQRQRERENRG